MKYDKRIITHQWGNNSTNDEFTSSNGFIIAANHYDKSFAFYAELAKEAKQDFPDLRDSDIECFVITESSYNKGFGGIRFHLPESTFKEGYKNASNLDFFTT